MYYLVFAAVVIVSFVIGAIGWAQIIGSIQNIKSNKAGIISIGIWLAVLVVAFLVAYKFFWDYKLGYIAAMIFSFLLNCRKQS